MITPTQQDQPSSVHSGDFSGGERFIQASGLAVTLFVLAAGVVSPDPPSHGAPETAVFAFYQQHAAGLLTGAFLWDLAMMALVLFAVALSRVFGRARLIGQPFTTASQPVVVSADLVRPFAAVTASLFVIAQAVISAAAVIATHGLPAAAVRTCDEISHMTGHLATLPLGSLLLAAGLGQATTRCSARWIGWLGVAAGSALILTTSWIAIGQQWIHNAGVIALLGFMLWTVASSISLLRLKRFPKS